MVRTLLPVKIIIELNCLLCTVSNKKIERIVTIALIFISDVRLTAILSVLEAAKSSNESTVGSNLTTANRAVNVPMLAVFIKKVVQHESNFLRHLSFTS